MNDDDRLYKRLREMKVPQAENRTHEERLRAELERLAAAPGPASRPRPAFRPKPVLIFGFAASAAAFAVGLVFLIRALAPAAPAAVARTPVSAEASLIMQSGETLRSGAPLATGDRLAPGDTVAVAGAAGAVLQFDQAALAELAPFTVLTYRDAALEGDALDIAAELKSGAVSIRLEKAERRTFTLSTEYAVFRAVGTEFTVRVTPGRGARLAVGAGSVETLSADGRRRSLGERVTAGRAVEIDAGGRPAAAAVSEDEGSGLERLREISLVPPAAEQRPLRVTVAAEPAASLVAVGRGLRGTGKIVFLAVPGRLYEVSVSCDGYRTQTLAMTYREDREVVFRLVKDDAPGPGPTPTPSAEPAPTASPVSRAVRVPRAGIAFSGSPADWRDLKPLAADPAGDAKVSEDGSDLRALYLARDEAFLYVGIRFENGVPPSAGLPEIALSFVSAADRLEITARLADRKWSVRGRAFRNGALVPGSDAEGEMTVGDSLLEMKFPILGARPVLEKDDGFSAVLSLKIQKYGRLRVSADETAPVTVSFE